MQAMDCMDVHAECIDPLDAIEHTTPKTASSPTPYYSLLCVASLSPGDHPEEAALKSAAIHVHTGYAGHNKVMSSSLQGLL